MSVWHIASGHCPSGYDMWHKQPFSIATKILRIEVHQRASNKRQDIQVQLSSCQAASLHITARISRGASICSIAAECMINT